MQEKDINFVNKIEFACAFQKGILLWIIKTLRNREKFFKTYFFKTNWNLCTFVWVFFFLSNMYLFIIIILIARVSLYVFNHYSITHIDLSRGKNEVFKCSKFIWLLLHSRFDKIIIWKFCLYVSWASIFTILFIKSKYS